MITKEIIEALEQGRTIHCLLNGIYYRKRSNKYECSVESYNEFKIIEKYEYYDQFNPVESISLTMEEILSCWEIVSEIESEDAKMSHIRKQLAKLGAYTYAYNRLSIDGACYVKKDLSLCFGHVYSLGENIYVSLQNVWEEITHWLTENNTLAAFGIKTAKGDIYTYSKKKDRLIKLDKEAHIIKRKLSALGKLVFSKRPSGLIRVQLKGYRYIDSEGKSADIVWNHAAKKSRALKDLWGELCVSFSIHKYHYLRESDQAIVYFDRDKEIFVRKEEDDGLDDVTRKILAKLEKISRVEFTNTLNGNIKVKLVDVLPESIIFDVGDTKIGAINRLWQGFRDHRTDILKHRDGKKFQYILILDDFISLPIKDSLKPPDKSAVEFDIVQALRYLDNFDLVRCIDTGVIYGKECVFIAPGIQDRKRIIYCKSDPGARTHGYWLECKEGIPWEFGNIEINSKWCFAL